MSGHFSGIVYAGDGFIVSNEDSSPSSYQVYRSGSDVYWYDGSSSTKLNQSAVARTVTDAPGGTTGVIADGTTYVTVTSDDANKVLTLPTPTPGNIVWAYVGANGYELRSDTPASVAINGGTGADAESAIAANTLVRCVCTSATTWVCSQFSTDGTESKVEAAA